MGVWVCSLRLAMSTLATAPSLARDGVPVAAVTNERMLPPTHRMDTLTEEDFRPTMEVRTQQTTENEAMFSGRDRDRIAERRGSGRWITSVSALAGYQLLNASGVLCDFA